jgi:hypothetical protein
MKTGDVVRKNSWPQKMESGTFSYGLHESQLSDSVFESLQKAFNIYVHTVFSRRMMYGCSGIL